MGEEASAAPVAAWCVCLRTNQLYVSSLAANAFEGGEQESPVCWCNQTLRELGPDGHSADPHSCRDPERECYQGPPV
jgi:hypothetical protein